MNSTLPEPQLPVAQYKLIFIAKDPIYFKDYPGVKWRGMLGGQFRKNACVTNQRYCENCDYKFSCSYSYVFNSFVPPWSKKMLKYEKIPHPYVIQSDASVQNIKPGDKIEIMLCLFGDADRHLQEILKSFHQSGLNGMTKLRKKMHLTEVFETNFLSGKITEIWKNKISPHSAGVAIKIPAFQHKPVRLTFQTPLRLQKENKNQENKNQKKKEAERIDKSQIQFNHLFGSLLRRCSMLTYFHTKTPLETEFEELTQLAKSIKIQQKMLFHSPCGRYSSKEDKWIDKSGYIGFIDIPAENLQPFWPYLWLGQFTNAGYGTTIGMGGYSISYL